MNAILRILASMGVGLIPGARGTYGSLLTLALLAPLVTIYGPLGGPWFWLAGIVLWSLALIISHFALIRCVFGSDKDPGCIVIDEAIGQYLALWGASTWLDMGLAFVLFRFFDIVKPWPVGPSQKLPGAVGVVIDDVLAGIISALILLATHQFM